LLGRVPGDDFSIENSWFADLLKGFDQLGETFADVFARWQIPAILCARTGLGTINHTLLSVEAMRKRLIPILGVAFIGDEYPDTQKTIEEMGHVRILGRLPYLNPLTAETLRRALREQFDISSIWEAIT